MPRNEATGTHVSSRIECVKKKHYVGQYPVWGLSSFGNSKACSGSGRDPPRNPPYLVRPACIFTCINIPFTINVFQYVITQQNVFSFFLSETIRILFFLSIKFSGNRVKNKITSEITRFLVSKYEDTGC